MADPSIPANSPIFESTTKVHDPSMNGVSRPVRVPHAHTWAPSNYRERMVAMGSRFKYHLAPFLDSNTETKAPTSHEEIAGEHKWMLPLLEGKLQEKDFRVTWKDKIPILKTSIDLTFARIMTELYWKGVQARSEKDAAASDSWSFPIMKTMLGLSFAWMTTLLFRKHPQKISIESASTSTPLQGNIPAHEQNRQHSIDQDLLLLEECFWQAGGHPMWEDLCQGVQDICQKIGIPGADFAEPSRGADGIQSFYLHQESNRQHITLLEQFDDQKKLVSSLSFRHVMEHLAPSSSNKNTKEWAKFWHKAFENAIPPVEGQSGKKKYNLANLNISHPLAKLFETLHGTRPDVIKTQGEIMYSILSANIHGFSGDMSLESSKWNTIEKAILEAIQPTELISGTKEIDWEAEREKYE